ncbi:MAG: GIY-YIG nuclease family protein [bacterium]|nr:GIY-YIG nuclease family protein [bacterium]
MAQYVYVLTNPAMPGMVKIGQTSQDDVSTRVAQLYQTGVPVPFDIEFTASVDNSSDVESALHTAFAPYRVNPRREFFRIDPEQAIAILRLFHRGEQAVVARQAENEIDAESIAAGQQLRRRRPNMNFLEMGIPIGSTLHFTQGEASVTVTTEKRVRLGGQELLFNSRNTAVVECRL